MLSSGLIWGGGSAFRWWTSWREWEIKMQQKYERFLNRVETPGNWSNNFVFFFMKHLTPLHQGLISMWHMHMLLQSWPTCQIIFSTAPPCFLIIMERSNWLWEWTKQCPGPESSPATPISSAVDPCWAYPTDCHPRQVLPKAEKAADSYS